MIEAVFFVFIVGGLLIFAIWLLGFSFIDPRVVFVLLLLMIAPGFYAAVVSGPFVPSSRKRCKAMLEIAEIKKTDVVYDLGCGDGRLIFPAAKKAKKATGYELSVPLYLFGKIRQLFGPKTASIRYGNIWHQDYRDADVIFCYLLPKAMKEFYEKIWPTLQPGTRVISNAFPIHAVKPQKTEEKVYLYIV